MDFSIFRDFLKHMTHTKYFFAHNLEVINLSFTSFLAAIELNTVHISYEFYSFISITLVSTSH